MPRSKPPFWLPPFMSSDDIPSKWVPAIRFVLAGIALFVFFMEAVINFNDEKPTKGFIMAACFIVTFIVAVKWHAITDFVAHRRRTMAWIFIAAGAASLALGIWLLSTQGPSVTAQAGHVDVPATQAPPQGQILDHALLRLMIRRGQLPQELTRENVWRWSVYNMEARLPNGDLDPQATVVQFNVIFDPPVDDAYVRVFSPGNPDWRFVIADHSQRGASFALVGTNPPDGSIIELHVTATPN